MSTEVNLYIYSKLFFDIDRKFNRERIIFSVNGADITGYLHGKE